MAITLLSPRKDRATAEAQDDEPSEAPVGVGLSSAQAERFRESLSSPSACDLPQSMNWPAVSGLQLLQIISLYQGIGSRFLSAAGWIIYIHTIGRGSATVNMEQGNHNEIPISSAIA